MNRPVLKTPAFLRLARRFIRRHPQFIETLDEVLALMEEDVFDPRLRTHKLKGDLAAYWSSSAGYDVRIMFRFAVVNDVESVLLVSIGTHDDVY